MNLGLNAFGGTSITEINLPIRWNGLLGTAIYDSSTCIQRLTGMLPTLRLDPVINPKQRQDGSHYILPYETPLEADRRSEGINLWCRGEPPSVFV